MHHRSEPSLEPWRAHLAALPEVDPPEQLWQRLAAARAGRGGVARRRWPWVAAAAAAMALALSWPRAIPEPRPVPPLADHPAVDMNLRLLDQELALAYARHAGEAEIAALWQTRERLLAVGTQSDPPLVARL